jgi:hypothetical protein
MANAGMPMQSKNANSFEADWRCVWWSIALFAFLRHRFRTLSCAPPLSFANPNAIALDPY